MKTKSSEIKKEDFWHQAVPVDAICIYRAGFGALLFSESLQWLFYSRELFSNDGFHLGIFMNFAPSPVLAFLLCLILVVAGAMITFGLWLRPAIITALGILIYLNGIDGLNEKALTTAQEVVLMILLISHCTNRYSADDWRLVFQKKDRLPQTACIFPQRLLQVYFAQIYFFCGIVKLMNPQWANGHALVEIFRSRWATDFGVWLASLFPEMILVLAAKATILFELLAGPLLFVPGAKRWVIITGVCFHFMIFLTLKVGYLSHHFIFALLVLFPSAEGVAGFAGHFRKQLLKIFSKGRLTEQVS